MAAKKKTAIQKTTNTGELIVDQIRNMGVAINLTMPDNADQAWGMLRREENEAALNMARRGMLGLFLKQALPHGEFEKELIARGFVPQRMREAMTVAAMLAKLPSQTLKKLAPVSGSKLIELARLPLEAIEALDKEGEIDDIDKMSHKELRENLRRTRLALEKADNRFKALHKAQQRAKALASIDDDDQWHEVTKFIRSESDALAEQASLAADGVEHLISMLRDPSLDINAANLNAAATTLYHQTRAPFAKLWRALDEMQKAFGDVIALDDSALPLFSEEEAKQAQSTRALLLGEHRAKAEARADKKKPAQRKRGRKTK